MHPRRAGRRTREILRNSGDSGKPAAQAKRGRPERGADRADRAGAADGTGAVRADRGGAAVRVGGENTHTGRLLTVENAVSSKRALIFPRFGL